MVLIFLLLAATFNLNNGLSSVITASAQEEPNTSPSAMDDSLTTDEDMPITSNALTDNDSDPDGDPLSISSVDATSINGGSISILAANNVTYSPPANFYGTDSFQYTISDGRGGTGTGNVTVTVNPLNDAPVANDDLQDTSENTTIQIDVLANDSDIDGDILSIVSLSSPLNGIVLLASGTGPVEYTPETGYNGIDSFTYEISDGNGGLDNATVTINVASVNDPPSASAGPDQTVDEGYLVSLNGTGSNDPDGSIESYYWNQTAGTPVALDNVTSATTTFIAPDVGSGGDILEFELTVTDNDGANSTDSVSITVVDTTPPPPPPNSSPTADAGPDQSINEGDTFSLNGTGSFDANNDTLTYFWNQTDGTPVELDDVTSITPSFTAPDVNANTTLTFELTVDDGNGGNSSDTVDVIVINVNEEPEADAGSDQNVPEGETVTLNGSASIDQDGFIESYFWNQTSGTQVILNNSASAASTFVAPQLVSGQDILTFELTVTDNDGANNTDSVSVTVIDVVPNSPPTAEAGPDQTVDENTIVTLNGTASSDSDGDALTYSWNQTAGPSVIVVNSTSATASFDAPEVASDGETLTFELTVTDDVGSNGTDIVTITVENVNKNPIADAGPEQTVNEASPVILNGSLSTDPDGDALTYFWVQTAGPGVSLSDQNSDKPSFNSPEVGQTGVLLSFELTVSDSNGGSSIDSVNIFVQNVNQAPLADAGEDQIINEGLIVTLNGTSSSDPDGGALAYSWKQAGEPAVTLVDATSATPSFTAPDVGSQGSILTFELTVTDSGGTTAKDTVQVTILNVNKSPIANAGADQTVYESESVTLNGSASNDPDIDNTLTYSWSQISGPSVILSEVNASNPTFIAPNIGSSGAVLTFRLIVQDDHGATASDEVSITVNNINGLPTANAGPDQTVDEISIVVLNGSASNDPDDDVLSYSWNQTSGPSVSLPNNTSSIELTFMAPSVGSIGSELIFQLTVNDGITGSSTDLVKIIVNNVNAPPLANASSDQTVNEGNNVTLSGAASTDPDGDSLTYSWIQTVGAAVALSGYNTANPSFIAPSVTTAGATLTFELKVMDSGGLSSTDFVNVTVNNVNQNPIADAGANQTVNEGDIVNLSAANSADPDEDTSSLTFSWEQKSGFPLILQNADSVNPWFIAPDMDSSQDALIFRLVVKDSADAISTDDVIITVNNAAGYHVSNYSPSFIATGSSFYEIPDSTSLRLKTFTATAWFKTSSSYSGNAMIVNKGGFGSDSAGQNMNYGIWFNSAEKLVAGFETSSGTDMFVTSSNTYNDGSWHYAVVTYDGSIIRLYVDGVQIGTKSTTTTPETNTSYPLRIGANSNPNGKINYFTGEIDEVRGWGRAITATEVSDHYNLGKFNTQEQLVYMNGASHTRTPIANAGTDKTVDERSTVTLDGTGSTDPDNEQLTYYWKQTAGPAVFLENAYSATPSFVAPDVGSSGATLAFELTVTNSKGGAANDIVTVSIQNTINLPPVANAGPDQMDVPEGTLVYLDGLLSSDPDGDTISYSWYQISGPTISLSSPSVAQPFFTAPLVAEGSNTLTFKLIVNDGLVDSLQDTVDIIVKDTGVAFPDFNFAAVGDFGCTDNTSAVMTAIKNMNPERVLGLGDYSYATSPDCWYEKITPIEDKMLNPSTVALGNHETADGKSERLDVAGRADLLNHFGLTEDTTFYSFDYQNVHFLVLDTEKPYNEGTAQHDFAKTDLYQARLNLDTDWIVVYFHRNIYGSSTNHEPLTDFRSMYQPIFDMYNVDLILQGHIHGYLRTKPLAYDSIVTNDTNTNSYIDPAGQIYVIVGTGGKSLTSTLGTFPYVATQHTTEYGFLNVDIVQNGGKLTGRFYDTTNQVIDEFTITKDISQTPPVANAGSDQSVSEGAVVTLDGSLSFDPDNGSGFLSSLSYEWKQIDNTGYKVTLSPDSTSSVLTFTAPQIPASSLQLVFKLTVFDDNGSSSYDIVNVLVNNVGEENQYVYDPSFVTSSNYYEIPDDISLRLMHFTATAWFKTSSSFSGNAMIVNKGGFGSDSAGQNMNYGIWMDSNEKLVAGFETSSGTDMFVVSSSKYNDGSWHYAVVTYDGSIIRLYVDGVQIGTKSTITTPETNVSYPLRIGANSNPNGNINYFKGEIDEVRVWNRTVTSTEVSDQYNLGISDKSGLLVHFNGICHVCAPIANAGADQTVDENLEVTLDGSESYDLNGGGLTYSWIQISGTPVTLSDSNIPNPTLNAPSVAPSDTLTFELTNTDSADDTLTFEMTVTNSDGLTSTDTVVVFVQNVNQLPIADAGPDQTVYEGSFVTLNGSASSDPDGDGLTYLWTQTTGPAVLLDNALSVNPTFTAPEVMENGATLTFALVVDDAHGGTSSDTVNVAAQHVNKPPVSNAGTDQTVNEGDPVILDGSGSFDPDSNLLTYSWIQVAGTAITLNNSSTATPSFIAPSVTSGGDVITFELTVTDSDDLSSTDAVNIQVNNINILPIADAGSDQTISEGDSVMLDGTLSLDLDGIISSYSWLQISGAPSVLLDGQTTSNPTFTAPYMTGDDIQLVFELTVMDNDRGTNSANVTITIQSVNQAPIADVGSDQTVSEYDSVILNGSASYDNDGSIVSFLWTQTSGPTATLTDATAATPSFVAPEVYSGGATLAFKLTVTDDYGEPGSSINDVSIYVMNINQPPIADAGLGQTVDEGTLVTLNGTDSSDPDGDMLSFNWTQIAGPSVTLSDRFVAEPAFTAPEVDENGATLTFELMVHDGNEENALTDFVDIIVKNVNKAPIADAGSDQTVDEGTAVTLDGTGSSDPDGITLSYIWTQTAGPVVALSNTNTSTPSFTTPNVINDVTTLTFQLTVSDILGANDTDTVDIMVKNIPGYSDNNYSPSFIATGSSYFDIPDHSSLHLKKFTAAAWFQTSSSFSGNVMIVNKGGFGSDSSGENMNYGIWFNSNEKLVAGFETSGGSDYFVTSSSTYNDGKWHYAVVTYDGSTLRLYIDGTQVASKSTTATPETNTSYPLRIGANSRGTNNYFVGEIDEVRIWNRAVTATEVSDQYEFGLINKDGRLVKMNGVDYNSTPTANAGPDQTVYEFDTVSLDGTASGDPDGDTLTYSWVQTAGPTVVLDDSNSAMPSFVAPEVYSGGATLTFELRVDDGDSTSSVDILNVIVKNINLAPIIDAGSDQTVDEGDPVTLDGTGSSDPDGDSLSYSWRQTFGPSVPLSGGSTVTPTFTAPLVTSATTLTFELTVNDGFTSNKDVVNVFVNDVMGGYNYAPSFSATGSNFFDIPDSSLLRLQQFTAAAWFKTSSSFSGNVMIVNKGGFGSDSSGENMNYGIWMDGNEKIVAGFETSGGADHFLTSSSTYNDDSWHYAVATYDGSTLRLYIDGTQIASKSTSSAKPDSSGTYPLRLGANSRGTNNYFTGEIDEIRVWDGAVTSTEVSNQFNLATFDMTGAVAYMDGTEYDTPPTANAGSDKTVYEEDIVTLNGGGSSDANGNPLTYTWTQINGPGVTLSDANIPDPQFTAPSVSSTGAVLKFRLTISDGTFESTDEVSVTVKNLSSIFTATGSNYYDIKYVSSIGLQKFSLGAMFKTSSSFSGDAAIANRGGFGSESSGQNMNYGIWMNSAEEIVAGFETSGGADHFLTSSSTYNDDQWHYAVVTYDGSTLRLYIDGTQIASKSTTAKPDNGGTQALRVGANSRALDSYFVGQIDEVKLVNRALSSSEVTEQFQSTSQIIQGEVVYFDGEIAYFAPVAKAGPDQTVDEGNYVTLDGSGSFDVNGYPITYSWKQTSGPVTVSLSSHTAAEPVFKAPSVVDKEVFTFQLTVNNGRYDSLDTVKITVDNVNVIAPRILMTPDYKNDVTKAIKSADEYVYVSMFFVEVFSDNKPINELAAAKARGVDVKLIVSNHSLALYPSLESDLKAKGIPYRIDSTHAKVVVIDDKFAYIGSANWNKNGLGNNWELTYKSNTPSTIAEAKEFVTQLWFKGSNIVRNNNIFSERLVNGFEYEEQVLSILKNAKSSIKVLMFEATYAFKDPDATHSKILNEVKNAYGRGVDLKMIFDDPRYWIMYGGKEFWDKYDIPHKLDEKDSGYLERKHVKAFLVDDSILIIGSQNWNRDSAGSPQEMSVIIRGNPAMVNDEYQALFQNQWNLSDKCVVNKTVVSCS